MKDGNGLPEFRTELDEEIYKRYPAVYSRLFSYFTTNMPDERHAVSTSALLEETGFITREVVIRYVLGRVSWAAEISDRHFVFADTSSAAPEEVRESPADGHGSQPSSPRENLSFEERVRLVLKRETARNRFGVSLLWIKHLCGNPDETVLERILTEAEWAGKRYGMYVYVGTESNADTESEPFAQAEAEEQPVSEGMEEADSVSAEPPVEPALPEKPCTDALAGESEDDLTFPEGETELSEQETAEPLDESAVTLADRYHLDPAEYEGIRIEDLGLSARADHCLRRERIDTVADLLSLTEPELRRIRNLGQKTIDELFACIAEINSRLCESEGEPSDQQQEGSLIRHRNLIFNGEFDHPDLRNLSAEDRFRLDQLREAYDCLNGTGILEQISNINHIAVYYQTLTALSVSLRQCREIRELIEKMPGERRLSSVRTYAMAYAGNDPEKGKLFQLLDDSIDTASFYNLTAKAGAFTAEEMTLIRSFLAWCTFDLNTAIEKAVEASADDERRRTVLRLRADGYTLERISNVIGVTREWIRQILQKACRSFIYWESRGRLMERISADLGGATVFPPEDVNRLCVNDAGVFLYLVKISLSSHYSYDSEHDLIIVGNENTEQRVRDYLEARRKEQQKQTESEKPVVEPADLVSELPNAYLYHTIPELTEYAEKLEREFRSCIYVGDIAVSDEDYALLCRSLRLIHDRYYTSEQYYTSTIVSTALVQIGLRKYDGRFWPHVGDVLGVNIDGVHQKWLGRCFYYTLEKYGKYRMDKGEMMNNILLHCFVTDHYADDLFDFLFAYYRIDLGRDLTNNTEERMDYLIRSMKNTEHSARSFKIKRHTADAATANEEECGRRINMILNYMDAGFFRQEYPRDSVNRIARLFCAWEERTSKLEYSRREWTPSGAVGTKQYKSPYLRFNSRREQFELVLPEQFVRLEDEDEMPNIVWEISLNGKMRTIETDPDNGVTGCTTNRLSVPIDVSEEIFSRFTVSLYKEDIRLNTVRIPENQVRFFDMTGETLSCDGYIPEGEACAFIREGCELLVSEQALMDEETHAGLTMLHLELTSGDVLRLPDGKALPVGRPLDEGLLDFGKVPGVYAIEEEEQIPVYRAVPNIFFRMNREQEAGTRILVNGAYERLRPDAYTRYDEDNSGDETGYTLVLQPYLEKSGIYDVVIDIPNSQKRREFRFAYIDGFDYRFSKKVYIFEESGSVLFSEGFSVDCHEEGVVRNGNRFIFPILPNRDELSFSVPSQDGDLQLRVYLPLFQWKFDDGEWNTGKPEELWHLEFPKTIYLKHPEDDVEFSMPPALLRTSGEDSREPVRFSAAFRKDKEQHLFVCDTRKMLSWLGFEEPVRLLTVAFSEERIPFVHIITRCFLPNKQCVVEERRASGELVFKTSILGFADCRADVYRGAEQIAEKLPITTGGIRVQCPFVSGDYRIDFYEENEEDDFGLEEYRKFDSLICHYENKNDLSDKSIVIKGIREHKQTGSIFAAKQYSLAEALRIEDLESDPDQPDGYIGKLTVSGTVLNVSVDFPSEDRRKAYITWYSAEEECYIDFFYNPAEKMIQPGECPGLMLDPDKHYFEIEIV